MTDDRLPYGKQFSPEQVDLAVILDLAHRHAGDRPGFEDAVRQVFFDRTTTSLSNRKTLAMNAFLSMRSYGLVEGGDATKAFALTAVGRELNKLRHRPTALLERFAEHILTELRGIQLLEVIDSLTARGVRVRVAAVAEELQAFGIDPGSSSGEAINPLRMWLDRAGVLRGWEIDDAALTRVSGSDITTITELASLSLRHRAFLLALASMTGAPPFDAAAVRRLAETQTPAARFDTKTFAKDVVEKLAGDGWLTTAKATTGRGAKSHRVTPTKRFRDVVSAPLAAALVEQTHLQDPRSLRKPVRQLLADVRSATLGNHQRGLALEGVCIQLLRLMGARFVDWRRRGDETQGAEVDVVGELVNGRYLLVQMQSKASRISGRDVVDREVGVATALKSNVILMVSAQTVSPAARRAAAAHMQEAGIAILFLDGADLERVETGAEVVRLLEREWRRVEAVRSPLSRDRAAAAR